MSALATLALPALLFGIGGTRALSPNTGAVCVTGETRREPDPNRPRYDLRVRVDLPARSLEGELTVRFTPDLSTDRLVFRLWPNSPADAWGASDPLSVSAARVDDVTIPVQRSNASTAVIGLPKLLMAGDSVDAWLRFSLRLPEIRNDRISVSAGSARLQTFFPLLGWEPGAGWGTTPATVGHAEAVMSTVADFTLALTTTPADLDVLATGVRDEANPGTWRAEAVRDVAVSLGKFRKASASIQIEGRDRPVSVTVGVHRSVREDPSLYLARVSGALRAFSRAYGPYPYPSFSLAITPGLRGGIESPMHAMQGPASIGRTTPHEVAHQWFYALVGNDQGRDPWLDEGVASWAEARYEKTLARFVDRPLPLEATHRLGAGMTYWDRNRNAYYRGAYVQAVQALAALGDAQRVDCALARYVAQHAYRVARPADLAEALTSEFPAARSVLSSYGATALE